MKKILALLLAVVVCLSLVACGSSKTNNNETQTDGNNLHEDTKSDEQQSTESASDTSRQETQNNDTIDENTKSDEITITTDNWQEYLELKLVEEWTANGYFLHYALCLRDEYADRQIARTTVLEIEWSGTWVYKEYSCDREAKTYEIGDVVADKPNEDTAKQATFLTQLLSLEYYANSKAVILVGGETDYNSYVKTIENFNVISASGTIRFE